MGETLPDFTIRGDIQSDYQSIAYIPQKLPEDLKKKTLHDYFFLDPADLDYSILYRWRRSCILMAIASLATKKLVVYQGVKL